MTSNPLLEAVTFWGVESQTVAFWLHAGHFTLIAFGKRNTVYTYTSPFVRSYKFDISI